MKKFLAIAAILAITTGLTACQTSKVVVTEPPKAPVETPKDSSGDKGSQPSKPEETKTPSTEPSSQKPAKDSEVSALYVGQIDGNSIEVKIDGKSAALFLTDSVKNSFNTSMFKSGSSVQITYSKNDVGQLILTSIRNDANGVSVFGVYVGQIDNNSLEAKIDGKATAFYLSDELHKSFKSGDFKSGEDIRVYYQKNSSGQIVLTDIHK